MKKIFIIPVVLFLGVITFSTDATATEVSNSEIESVACTYNVPSKGISVTASTCAQARAAIDIALKKR